MLVSTHLALLLLGIGNTPSVEVCCEPNSEALVRALLTITAPEISADIHFIASDELGGRDTPSRGQRIAARYIRSRLVRLGFEAGAEGGYFYNYSLAEHHFMEEMSFMELVQGDERTRLTFGKDYFVSMSSRGLRDHAGAAVFVGEFAGDVVEDLDLAGKWGVLAPGVSLSRKRLRAASGSGILGFVALPAEDAKSSVTEAHTRWLQAIRKPSQRSPSTYGVPVIYATEATAAKLIPVGQASVGESLGFDLREAFTVEKQEGETLENVCGLWPGSDPVLRGDVIIISAHYDHVGERDNGDIYNGADDNGSGTTGLLAVAEALEAYGPMRRSVLLMWVSGEEKGLLGSKAWTKNPWLPEGMRPFCNINIDMIGRNAPNEIGITPTKARAEYNRLTQLVEQHMGAEGFTKLNNVDAYWGRSDHASFSKNLDIPVAFLFSDVHEDYHKPTDTPDKIDCDKLARVARLVVRVLDDLQGDVVDFTPR